MVSSQFGAILKEFEPFFKCPLEPDSNDSCLINMGIGISIQMELNPHGFLLIGCCVGTLSMNPYRDLIIQQALQFNDTSSASQGILGFSHKSNHLILFLKIDPGLLTADQISTLVPNFISKAKLWKEAIDKGEIPKVRENSAQTPAGLFGLIS